VWDDGKSMFIEDCLAVTSHCRIFRHDVVVVVVVVVVIE